MIYNLIEHPVMIDGVKMVISLEANNETEFEQTMFALFEQRWAYLEHATYDNALRRWVW